MAYFFTAVGILLTISGIPVENRKLFPEVNQYNSIDKTYFTNHLSGNLIVIIEKPLIVSGILTKVKSNPFPAISSGKFH